MMDYGKILSSRVRQIQPSGIRKFFDILENMTDAISLGIGEPDFVTPWHIREAGIYSLEQGYTKYTSNAGMTRLRNEISAYLKRRFDLDYNAKDEIIVTVGGSEAIDLALRAIIEPDDEIIIPDPSFVCYSPLTSLSMGKPVLVPTKEENDFMLMPDELKAAITPRTKALILPFPCNPTGAVMTEDALRGIADVLRGTDIMIISDEIYAELSYGLHHTSPANIEGLKERTILVSGFSKAYAMTGWRLGYLCAPEPIVKQLLKIHQYGIMSAPTMSQYAAIEAMKNGDDDIERMKTAYNQRRRMMLKGLRELGFRCFEPRGAFYIFPNITSSGLGSEEFCTRFLREESVAVIPGTAFGPAGEGFVRMSYATSVEELEIALERLKKFMTRLEKE